MGSGRCRVRFRARADGRCFIVKLREKFGLVGPSVWFGDRFRTVFGSFSDHFRIIFGSFSDHAWIIFGSFSDRFWIVVGSFSDRFSDRVRTILGHVWEGPGIIFGTSFLLFFLGGGGPTPGEGR